MQRYYIFAAFANFGGRSVWKSVNEASPNSSNDKSVSFVYIFRKALCLFRGSVHHVRNSSSTKSGKDKNALLSVLVTRERTVEQFSFVRVQNFYYIYIIYIYNNLLLQLHTKNCSTVRSFAFKYKTPQKCHSFVSLSKRTGEQLNSWTVSLWNKNLIYYQHKEGGLLKGGLLQPKRPLLIPWKTASYLVRDRF